MRTEKGFFPCVRQRFAGQRGASLLEAISYLGIAAIVLLGAVSLLTGAFSNARANQALEEIIALRTAMRKMYIGQAYPANAVPTLITANAVPSTLARGANNTLINSWAGTVTVGVDPAGFAITYPNVPQDVCMSIVSGANGWVSISDGTVNINNFPATAANAAAVCSAATNNLVFTAN